LRSDRRMRTWRSDIQKGRIPVIYLGRQVRIRRSDLNALMARGFRPETR